MHLNSHEPPLSAQTQESQNAILSHCQRSKQQQPQQQHSHSHSHSHSPHHSRHTSPHSHSQQQQQQQQQQPQQSHAHSHHHHYRRKRRQATGSGSLPGAHTSNHHHSNNNNNTNTSSSRHSNGCSSSNRRRHRSVTDMSSNSINADREIQEIMMVRKTCCTELAQCFAEDLYGSSSRRPSSCCTSSDYCYQTDSTSLYGDSRSTLSRNNSIKSASAAIRKQQRLNNRQPSYTSISLRGLNDSSLTSIFDRAKQTASASGLPEYACSPSPIRWSFLAGDNDNNGSKSSTTEIEQRSVEREEEDKMDAWHVPEPEKKPCRKISYQDDDEGPSTSAAAAAARKRRSSSYHCEFEEEEASTTAILYHQDPGESFNNCCSNYIQCNTYLDQDLQITSEDIHQYLSKGQQSIDSSDILNNSKNYPFQPSNTLEFQYKNNFQQNGNQNVDQKETNLNQMEEQHHHHQQQQHHNQQQQQQQQQQTTNINLSTSSNNINIVFNSNMQSNAGTATAGNEVKFINNCNRSYDYTNMSGHLNFDKPLGIVELPKEFGVIGGGHADASINSTTASEHSSSLPSPTPMPHHFESFDAASEHNLMSPCLGSPGSVNPSGDDSFVHLHHHHSHPHSHQHTHQHQHQHTHYTHSHPHSHASSASASASSSHHHQQHQHMHTYNMADAEQFRLGNAFKKVRKRARKYTDFLRKK